MRPMEESEVREYSNGDVTVLWDSKKCAHSGRCVRGLPGVFNPKARPWINMVGATSDQIAEQVRQCPSGALSLKGEPLA